MIGTFCHKGFNFKANLSEPIDLSIPFKTGDDNVRAWYVPPVQIEPVRTDRFLGSVKEGGDVNFRNVSLNPHGNGTHTECVGHIAEEVYSVNSALRKFFFLARVITISPKESGDDRIIDTEHFTDLRKTSAEALCLRTLPNGEDKLSMNYSNSNPPFITAPAMQMILDAGVNHFLTDLPSVDRESDGGKLASHHVFWEHPQNTNTLRTITEFIFIPDHVADGLYLLELQVAPLENDASPSRPVLYSIIEA